jgi:predicted transcriptional regulator of viral defense system
MRAYDKAMSPCSFCYAETGARLFIILFSSKTFKYLFLLFLFILYLVVFTKMKKTIENMGLSPNQERIMSILEYKKIEIVGRKELIVLIKKYLEIKDISDLITKLQSKKRLVPIKKGVYMIVPFSSVDKKWALDDYKIADYLLKQDYYIGLFNSFNFHGFTEQIPNKIFIFNTKYSADKKILHYRFKFFKVKREKIFGVTNNKYPYSDRERTIIDALEYPEYLGGLSEVIDRVNSSKYDKAKLIDYAIRYKSIKIMKLVGMLTKDLRLLGILKNKKALSYYTTLKRTGTKLLEKKWKLRLI